jgi:hypothetical protein
MTPSIRLAVTLVFSARHDGSGGHAAKPAPPSPSPTPLPSAAPLATASHGGPPGLGRHRQARPQTGTMVPPRRGRLCPAFSGIDHWPRSRPPWLCTTEIAWGGGEGGATLGGGGGGEGGGRPGVGRCHDVVPPHILVAVRRFLWRGQGSYIGNRG